VPTINRVLQRRGLIVPQPQKRPRSSWHRFAYVERNGCWQMDAFQWRLADGTPCAIFEALDDCTRLELDTRAAAGETSKGALACFLTAVEAYGVPAKLLSDNGTAFSGRRRGWISRLEREAVALGVKVVTSTPGHPQTCGKNERAHQTCQLWLAHQPTATTLAELQLQLDHYRQLYNTIRPHQALGGRTPAEAAQSAPLALPGPPPPPDPAPPTVAQRWVGPNGALTFKNHLIYVGRRYTRRQLTIISAGDHVQVLNGRTLLRELDLDPTRRYQLEQRPSDTHP
jgi:transposase InsO family protein